MPGNDGYSQPTGGHAESSQMEARLKGGLTLPPLLICSWEQNV